MATAKATFEADPAGDAASLATTGAVLPGAERAKFEAYHAAHTADSFDSSADGSTYASDFVLAALDDDFNGAEMISLPVHTPFLFFFDLPFLPAAAADRGGPRRVYRISKPTTAPRPQLRSAAGKRALRTRHGRS